MSEPWEHLGSVGAVLTGMGRACVLKGDCMELGSLVPDASIDALVTDPPSGISFMSKSWDGDKGGRDQWIAWLAERMRLAYRLLKPGAHALVWAIPRTSHWTATAIEDAGFEIRDVVMHLFGSGFPKSLDVSKAIDETLGAQREVVGRHAVPGDLMQQMSAGGAPGNAWTGEKLGPAVTEEAARWEGWGTALKPAAEHWILARKPLDSTVARNVLEHGTGGLNIDACRIGTGGGGGGGGGFGDSWSEGSGLAKGYEPRVEPGTVGRWPAHVTLSHVEGCELIGSETEQRPLIENAGGPDPSGEGFGGKYGSRAIGSVAVSRDVYRCAQGCPVAMLDAQSGVQKDGVATNRNRTPGETPQGYVYEGGWKTRTDDVGYGGGGGASRFFYVAKPARAEKEAGLKHLPVREGTELTGRDADSAGINHPRAGAGARNGARNSHPTVKPVDLMRWLCRLITPPGGVVLDMFAGSGTTLVAALDEDFRVIGCELDADGEYIPLIVGRVTEALGRHKQMELSL